MNKVASQTQHQTTSTLLSVSGILQRKCACGNHTSAGGECGACSKKQLNLQRRAVDNRSEHSEVPSIVHEVLRSPGQPLDPATRAFMEPRFGHDFSHVRVHTDAKASESARAVYALAYTVGQDVVFGTAQYRLGMPDGQHLIAHELAHAIQQSTAIQYSRDTLAVSGPGDPSEREADAAADAVMRSDFGASIHGFPTQIARQTLPPATPSPSPPQTQQQFGAACSGGANDPCQFSRCSSGQPRTVRGDISRAIRYVNTASGALNASPLATNTTRALDWYFNDHSETTINEVRRRLTCIQTCLTDTQTNNRYGCHPDYPDTLAYVCVGGTDICNHVATNICFTDRHFGEGDRGRAETVIHECAHRVGMSLRARNLPDIYSHTSRFLYIDTAESLRNSDSFALFAGAIAEGMRVTVLPVIGVTGGAAIPSSGVATWQARLYLGAEFQHPVLSIFNPTLGLGMSVIGETTIPGTTPVSSPASLISSLLPGIRIGAPRPGAAGGGYASFFGGPSIAISAGVGGTPVGLGAEAGTAVGYRWRWLDVSGGVGYAYDPTRKTGMEHLFTAGISVTFIPR
jgi:hypothetical protein